MINMANIITWHEFIQQNYPHCDNRKSCIRRATGWLKEIKFDEKKAEKFFLNLIDKYHEPFCNEKPFEEIKELVNDCIKEMQDFLEERPKTWKDKEIMYLVYKRILLGKFIDNHKYDLLIHEFCEQMDF